MPQKENKLGLYLTLAGIGVLVLVVVGFAMKSKIQKRLKEACTAGGGTWNKKTKKCIAPMVIVTDTGTTTTTPSTPTGQPSTVQWNPNILAGEISRNLEGWNLATYPETAEKVLKLTDDQIKLLYVHYNKNFAKDYPTMTQLFENEWDDWGGKYNLVVDRLRAIGLN